MSVTTTTTENSNLQTYVNQKTLENFRSQLYFYDMGEKSVWEDGAFSIKWLKFNKLNLSSDTALLTEGTTPSEQNFGATTISITPKQFGEYVSLTDMLLDTDPVSYVDGAVQEISDNMAKIVDDYIQATVDAANTNVLYSGSATQRSDLDKTNDIIKASDLNKARTLLETAGVPKIDGYYVAIMHPLVYHDLLAETGTGSFIETAKYAAPEKLFKGEIGALFGVRIVVSGNVKYYGGAGTSSANVYPTYVIGKGAYGVPTLRSIETYITPRMATDSDPLAQRVKVGAKVAFGCKILQSDAIQKIESATTL